MRCKLTDDDEQQQKKHDARVVPDNPESANGARTSSLVKNRRIMHQHLALPESQKERQDSALSAPFFPPTILTNRRDLHTTQGTDLTKRL
ncbi:hypothetical protein K449DRAFT_464841 [Hypoxylon sp. EC38]|nr:hypothetical protein K449DRAFT_464841 [Hypoxylon sp. EC38]